MAAWGEDHGCGSVMVHEHHASPEDRSIIVPDEASFIGASWAWLVEEKWITGAPTEGELRTRTDGVKRVSLHREGTE